MRDAELVPELLVIVHGLIIKWWLLVLLKEIIGVRAGLKLFLNIGLVD